jgi:hypothetical protein
MKPQYLPVLGAAQCYAVCAAYNRHKYLQAPKQISLLYRFSSEDCSCPSSPTERLPMLSSVYSFLFALTLFALAKADWGTVSCTDSLGGHIVDVRYTPDRHVLPSSEIANVNNAAYGESDRMRRPTTARPL